MRLEPGSLAPEISAMAADGAAVSLAHYRGSPLWLILSRWATCPFCSLRLDRIARSFDDLAEVGVKLLVLFPSPLERVQRYMDAYAPPFDTAADPERLTFVKYGTENSWAGEFRSVGNLKTSFEALRSAKLNPLPFDGDPHQMPADFLIDSAGVLRRTHYGGELDDGFSVKDVHSWAQSA